MNEQAKKNLQALGFNPSDLENSEDMSFLEELLSDINEENILSAEEAEALEYAAIVGLEDDEIAKKLQEHGIDEDIFEVDQLTVKCFENKLRSLESNVWDDTIDELRQQHNKLEKSLKELCEELDVININAHIKLGQEMWSKNWIELERLFQELNSVITNGNSQTPDAFKEFSESFGNEVNMFIEHSIQFIKKMWVKKITLDKNGKLRKSSEENGEASNNTTNSYNEELEKLKPRLTGLHYNLQSLRNEEQNGFNRNVQMISELSLKNYLRNSTKEEVDVKELEAYFLDVLNLSEKQMQLQIKKNGILHILECIIADRETWLDASKEFIEILQKQKVLLDFAYVVKILWHQASDTAHQVVNYCCEYFHEEVANTKARIACLEEHKEKFGVYVNEKQNMFPQKLETLVNKYFSTEEQCVQDLITAHENELELALSHQKVYLLDSKKQLLEIEKHITKIEDDLNLDMEKLSEFSLGFNASIKFLETRKEERINIQTLISQSPFEWNRRLLWVHFLTDIKRLQDMKEQVERVPENNAPGTPSFVKEYPCFTSTPKDD